MSDRPRPARPRPPLTTPRVLPDGLGDEQYEPTYVRALFDEMAASYDLVNTLTSFGFNDRWRRQVLVPLRLRPDADVVDLMCGMGEGWPALGRAVKASLRVTAVDLSPAMCSGARTRTRRHPHLNVMVLEEDALRTSLPDGQYDAVICSFGLKTLAPAQVPVLAREVRRLLRPGGTFSFVEISVPPLALLRIPYLWYLTRIIPVFGTLLGNPENYRLLGRYTRAFGSCHRFVQAFEEAGLEVHVRSYFFGCATGLAGRRSD